MSIRLGSIADDGVTVAGLTMPALLRLAALIALVQAIAHGAAHGADALAAIHAMKGHAVLSAGFARGDWRIGDSLLVAAPFWNLAGRTARRSGASGSLILDRVPVLRGQWGAGCARRERALYWRHGTQ